MTTKAVIVDGNPKRGLFIFQRLADEEYGYLELIGAPDLERGDVLVGDFYALAGETVKRLSDGDDVDVIIQDYCSLKMAQKMVFGR